MELGCNWRESSPCNLLTAQRLSVDYTLFSSSISEKRPSICDIRAVLLRCIVCSHVAAVLVPAERSAGLVFRQLRETVRARVAQGGAAIRARCAYLQWFDWAMNVHGCRSSGAALYCALIQQYCWHSRCNSLFLTRWSFANCVHESVQDEWQGETGSRVKPVWPVCSAVCTVLCNEAH